MDENGVWRASIKFLENNGWTIVCACPPSASGYAYPICRFYGSRDSRDEPDIVAQHESTLLLIECKPTFPAIKAKRSNGENDIDKLLRLRREILAGEHQEHLLKQYSVSVPSLDEILVGISYCGTYSSEEMGVVHLVVDPDSNRVSKFC